MGYLDDDYQKKYYQKRRKDKNFLNYRQKKHQEWYDRNKEKAKERFKIYYEKNKDELIRKQKKYYTKNRSRILEVAKKYYYDIVYTRLIQRANQKWLNKKTIKICKPKSLNNIELYRDQEGVS